MEHTLPQAGPLHRVTADNEGCKQFVNEGRSRALSPADESVLRGDLYERRGALIDPTLRPAKGRLYITA